MAQRILEPYRLHPLAHDWVVKKAGEMNRSRGYMLEWCIKIAAGDEISPRFEPGIKMEGDDDQ